MSYENISQLQLSSKYYSCENLPTLLYSDGGEGVHVFLSLCEILSHWFYILVSPTYVRFRENPINCP